MLANIELSPFSRFRSRFSLQKGSNFVNSFEVSIRNNPTSGWPKFSGYPIPPPPWSSLSLDRFCFVSGNFETRWSRYPLAGYQLVPGIMFTKSGAKANTPLTDIFVLDICINDTIYFSIHCLADWIIGEFNLISIEIVELQIRSSKVVPE